MTTALEGLACKLSETKGKITELESKVKELKSLKDQQQRSLCDAMTEAGINGVTVEGYAPFKMSKNTFWNITDYGKLLQRFIENPEIGKLNSTNVKGFLNEELRSNSNFNPEEYGVNGYEKFTINGGKKTS